MKRILLIEDNDQHAKLVSRYVTAFSGPPVELVRAGALAAGLDLLAGSRFDAVLLDLHLPDSSSGTTLEEVARAAPSVPLVVLTSVGDLDFAADAVGHGADDYVVKSELSPEVLHRAVRYAVQRKRASRRLRRRTEQLEESNEALQHFAHTMAHELIQPLNRASTQLELVRMDLDRDREAADVALGKAESGLRDMAEMIHDLLAFASLEQADRQRADCDLAKLLRGVLDNLAPQIDEADAKVTSAALPTVPCNDRYLRHVLGNLVANALKYRRDEAPEIRLEAEDLGDSWKIAVTDNGVGIEEQDLPVVFDLFRRLPSQSHREGSGIGLALCRRIVEHHRGVIGVESTPGEGSTFWFTLPKE